LSEYVYFLQASTAEMLNVQPVLKIISVMGLKVTIAALCVRRMNFCVLRAAALPMGCVKSAQTVFGAMV
jgi:hypothetical protein